MELEPMIARLLAEIRTNREEMRTNQAELLARVKAMADVNLKEMKEELAERLEAKMEDEI
jgi:hypothetical protein